MIDDHRVGEAGDITKERTATDRRVVAASCVGPKRFNTICSIVAASIVIQEHIPTSRRVTEACCVNKQRLKTRCRVAGSFAVFERKSTDRRVVIAADVAS